MQVWKKNALVAAIATMVLPTMVSASVVYIDNFEGDTVSAAPQGWATYSSSGPSSSSIAISAAADSTAGGGSAKAMDVNQTTTATRYVLATFANPATLQVGDSIQLSYDLWFQTNPPPSMDRLFRYGLYNSALTNSPGITGRIGTGADPSPTAYLDEYDSPKVFDVTTGDGAKQTASDKTDSAAAIGDDNLRFITLTATLVAGSPSPSMTLTNSVYDANGNLLGSASGADTTLNDNTFTFNELAIGINGTTPSAAEYRIDNVNVTYTPAPEPACLGVLSLIPTVMRRRKSY